MYNNLKLKSMKKVLFFATALLALASCTSDDFVGKEDIGKANEIAPISFGFNVPTPTRSSGADAADALNEQFIVWGEKSEAGDGSEAEAGNLVFMNYLVKWTDNSAYTTTSNTKNWEYVGYKYDDDDYSEDYTSNITPNGGEAVQTIKYWDYSATSYTFTAVSALPADITAGDITITKTESGTDDYGKGYVVEVSEDASLEDLYFSERLPIAKPATTGDDRTAVNTYGGIAELKFYSAITQVRAGVYETIPGYDVTSITFYVTNDAEAEDDNGDPAFGAICPNAKADGFEGTITVTYYDDTDAAIENHPKLSYELPSGTNAATDLILGTNLSTINTTTPMGITSAAPTWDTEDGEYTMVMPQIDNDENLQLKVDYVLYNSVSGETITVTGATAEVPAEYLAWKPNFKYTYLFKISNNTNGSTGTGTDPAGLYPITFDAVVVVAEDGTAEYITTVSEPSITTFGVDATGKYVEGGDDYAAGSDVYVTIVDEGDVVEPELGTNVNIYKNIETSDDNFEINEASLAEAIAEESALDKVITYDLDNDLGEEVEAVPGEDGVDIDIYAVKLEGLAAGLYAVEYVKTARTYAVVEVTIANAAEFADVKAAIKLYTDATGDTELASDATFDAEAHYYKKVVTDAGEYVYKIIKVQ